MPQNSRRHIDRPALFAAALLVAVGGLIYELILGTAASYLFGDSIVSFSIATGVTLFGMGIGSLIASKFAKRAGRNFAWNEIILGLIGGNSVLILFAAFSLTPIYWLVFVVLSLIIGILIGLEIPLLIGLFNDYGRKSTIKLLGRVLALDYFGALIASLLFPFLLLPYLGLMRTAYLVALLNIGIALYILWRLGSLKRMFAAAILIIGLLLGGFIYASRIEQAIDAKAYQDPVVFYNFSAYQKIVMTQYKDDTRLYLNNQLQFSSLDEARYHETLAHAAMTSMGEPKSVLILGGGDGLLAREILKYPSVTSITLVDIDPKMTNIAKDSRLLVDINKKSMQNPKVHIVNEDAFTYMKNKSGMHDVIIADLVDPSNERIAKLYSKEFYRYGLERLNPNGVFITQATSTYFTASAFSTIASTVKTAQPNRQIIPLGLNVPSFGEWGFVMSLPEGATPFAAGEIPTDVAYISKDKLQQTLNNVSVDPNAAVSTLLHPTVYQKYQVGMQQWRY